MAVALVSIKEQFANAIFAGDKCVEFRKTSLPVEVDRLLFYVTKPTGLVMGECRVIEQVVATPSTLWDQFSSVAGVDEVAFREYYLGRLRGVGIVIERARRFNTPLTLEQIGVFGGPPMSMITLKENRFSQ
jgi:predicted transcriptional regulator